MTPDGEAWRARGSKLLGEVVLHLQQIHSAVAVAVAALKQQNSELDVDIATVLQRGAADKIQEQIDKLAAVQRLMGPSRDK